MKVLSLLTFVIIAFSCSESPKSAPPIEENQEELFTNPLLSSGADPWVIQRNDTYYYTHTAGNRLVLYETDRMEDLGEAQPLTIWTPPEGEAYSHQLWAPELHFIDGKWYMYFAASYDDGTPNSMDKNRRMFVLENASESPMNTDWVFKGKITDETDHWAIDGTVLNVDGSNYFIWSGWRTRDQPENTGRQQLYIAKMTNPWTLEGERVMVSEPEHDWERNGLVNEGAVAWKNPSGELFVFYSGSGCWTDDYKIGVLKLTDQGNPLDLGSWEKSAEPVFEKNIQNEVFAPGHNSFFKSPNGKEDWILYHANDQSGEGCGGLRKPRIQKFTWDENGFPVMGDPISTDVKLQVPSSH